MSSRRTPPSSPSRTSIFLVSLTEEPPDAAVLSDHGIEQLHLPVVDFTPPTREQMTAFVAAVREGNAAGRAVGVHCTAGLGRSGTMLAAYFIAGGMSAEQAVAHVRDLRPESIETETQEAALRRFAGARQGQP